MGVGKKLVIFLAVFIILPTLLGLFMIFTQVNKNIKDMEQETVTNKNKVVQKLSHSSEGI